MSSTPQKLAGDRIVDVAAGQIGGQALRLGLIGQVVVAKNGQPEPNTAGTG